MSSIPETSTRRIDIVDGPTLTEWDRIAARLKRGEPVSILLTLQDGAGEPFEQPVAISEAGFNHGQAKFKLTYDGNSVPGYMNAKKRGSIYP